MTTSTRFISTSKSQCASIISRPLLNSVAESIVIFGPMFQVGCFNACSGVIESKSFCGISRKNSRLVLERAPEDVDLRFIDEANKWRARFIRDRAEFLGIAIRGQSDDLHPFRNIARHLQRALADRSCRAQNDDTFTLHS